ncbi:MAG: class I SAM-dependent methyltransferase [bacterium]|nr:class I SAM-dependent methyltransferase [bacterium]
MKERLAKELLEKTKKDYNLIAEEFSRTRRNLWSELFAVFKDYTKEKDKVLDVGCGNGRFLDLLGQKKIDYIGVDNSEEQIREAQKKYPDRNFLVADALNLPFPNDSFDKVFLIAVLHHIPSINLRIKVLAELQRVLKPGGFLLLTVWRPPLAEILKLISKYSFLRLIRRSKMDFGDVLVPWGSRVERYYHFFKKSEIMELANRAGFKTLKSEIVRNQTGKRSNLYLIAQKSP